MVEIKYDESKNNLKLPKNIRQVGKPDEKVKIYVEDYVITYINQIAQESSEKQRLAVLLGSLGKNQDSSIAFINGAVEAKGVVVQEDQIVFTSEIWTEIYDKIGQYFHNTEIVGWFLTRPGKSLGINDKIKKIHADNFPGVDKALFIVDPVDHEEAFYVYNHGELERQEGYYIYYDRNEDMQNYMIDHKGGEGTEPTENILFQKKKEEILERRQAQKKSSDKKDSFAKELYGGMKRASSLVATFAILFALIFGFSQLNRKTGMDGSEDLSTIPVNVAEGDVMVQEDSAMTAESADGETPGSVSAKADPEDAIGGAVAETKAVSEMEAVSETEAVDVAEAESQIVIVEGDPGSPEDLPVQNVIRQYEVRLGDTLAEISQRFYQDYKYIELIQEMNQIEDPDMIFPGMMLNLP